MASSSIMAPGRAELCLETILNLSWSLAACAKFPILLDPRNLKNVFLVRIFSQINPSQIFLETNFLKRIVRGLHDF